MIELDSNAEQPVLQVSDLTQVARILLEGQFSNIVVCGEVSNFSAPRSGHWYFSLKDDKAQVRCAMFRGANSRVKFLVQDGKQVMLKANVSLYEPRGDFQLIVNAMEEQGDGALQQAFEKLKLQLAKEGLFANEHKKAFPAMTHCLGVITSTTGAAIRDVLTTLKRRYPAMEIKVYPSTVQGKQAAAQIVAAIKQANQNQYCDALLLVRGGGSLEDLWPFNEEIVARAMFDSNLPIVSGVGHEVDFTIADFVADHRSATPTAAAEFISPNQTELSNLIRQHQLKIQQSIKQLLQHYQEKILWMRKHIQAQHPKQQLLQKTQQVDHLLQRLTQAQKQQLSAKIALFKEIVGKLNTLSPLQTLSRGYTITASNNKVIASTALLKKGDTLLTKFVDGTVTSTVNTID